MIGGNQNPTKPTRRREMDLMGILIVIGLVLLHCAQFSGGTGFCAENPGQSTSTGLAANVLLAFGNMWGMPQMQLIAGTAIWYSL